MTLLLPAVASGKPTLNQIHNCSAMTLLKALPDNCIDCVVTSPPYFGLRSYLTDGDYNKSNEIGLEPTPQAYVQTLVTLFREVRRALKGSGTFWLNLGDSYANDDKWGGSTGGKHVTELHGNTGIGRQKRETGLPSKNLMLIPHRVAIALQDDGWIVRQDNVWHKPNPMPESVTDRTTRAHEYVFQLVKSGRYYYDAEAVEEKALQPFGEAKLTGQVKRGVLQSLSTSTLGTHQGEMYRNKRSVWTISPAQFRDAHFATFPYELPEICIKAGCPIGGLVLDPFMGSGTTALVARDLGRNFIGSELSAEYMTIIRNRLAKPYTPDMFIMQALEASLS